MKLVKLHISKKKKQDCHLAGAPALTSLYSIVNNCQVDLPSQEIVKIEKDLQAQFNMGAYEYTVKAVRIHGDWYVCVSIKLYSNEWSFGIVYGT